MPVQSSYFLDKKILSDMATPMPTPKYVIIWLDQHIGLLESNKQLKSSIGEQTDPERKFPAPPPNEPPSPDDVINQLILFQTNFKQSFSGIPNNLKAFDQIPECLKCIGENLDKNMKIFFITSGSMGEKIAPEIMKKYPSLKTIYVFCGYYRAHVEWAEDCLDQGVSCIFCNFHTDLLVRLLRDVAEYFISEGDGELTRDEKLAYSAIFYFEWAKLLFERANNFAMIKIYVRLKYVDERILFMEPLIQKLNENNDEDKVSIELS
jgi:hypothetical protein